MILGVLLRLLVTTVFFLMAYYVLRPENLKSLLEDLTERLGQPKDAFDRVQEYRPHLVKGFYALSAIFLIATGWFIFVQTRELKIQPDPQRNALPYTQPQQQRQYQQPYRRPAPGASQPSGQAQPYAGQQSQPYRRPANPYASSSSGVQSAPGGAQPYRR